PIVGPAECVAGRQLQRHYDVRLGVADPGDALDLGQHGLRQRRVTLNLDIGEDVRLPPTRVSLLHTLRPAQRRYDRLVLAGLDRYEYIGGNHLPVLRFTNSSLRRRVTAPGERRVATFRAGRWGLAGSGRRRREE